MYFRDLDLCNYHYGHLDSANWAVPLSAVGWLEHPHPFAKDSQTEAFRSRLAELVGACYVHFPHYQYRGVHECSLCVAAGLNSPREARWSQENLFVPGIGTVYVAPGGIVHYINDHGYAPPSAFVSAVLACPDVGSAEYEAALLNANAGFQVPMLTHAQVCKQDAARRTFREELGMRVPGAPFERVLAAARKAWPESEALAEDGSVLAGEYRVAFDDSGLAIDMLVDGISILQSRRPR